MEGLRPGRIAILPPHLASNTTPPAVTGPVPCGTDVAIRSGALGATCLFHTDNFLFCRDSLIPSSLRSYIRPISSYIICIIHSHRISLPSRLAQVGPVVGGTVGGIPCLKSLRAGPSVRGSLGANLGSRSFRAGPREGGSADTISSLLSRWYGRTSVDRNLTGLLGRSKVKS